MSRPPLTVADVARTIVVGDVQGCRVELEQLMAKVEYQRGRDRLILAGDLLDRGPDSAGVVRWAMENGAEAVQGNHEEAHLRFHRHEMRRLANPRYVNPMRDRAPGSPHRVVYDSITEAQWIWLSRLPMFLHINDHWTVVHAGCLPGKPIEDQDVRHLARLRYVRRDGLKMANLGEPMTGDTHAFWTELWYGPRSIIYGHHVDKRGAVLSTPLNFPSVVHDGERLTDFGEAVGATLGIDTGCCFGGSLSAAIFVGSLIDIVSVPATGKWADQHEEEAA